MGLMDWLEAEEAAEAAAASENSKPEYVNIHSNGDGVLDRLNEAAEWEDILVYGAQWETAKPQDRETLRAFKRPGGTYDISAKVLKANPHVLVVHSDAAGLPYGKGQKLTKGRVYAHLHYNGDLKAAAKALARGEAVGLPAHVVDAVQSRDTIVGTVTEVTASQITGDNPEDEPDEVQSSWRPLDLRSVVDGTWQPPQPSIGQRTDGKGLFYPGKTHTVVSETEAGKTWLALAAAIHEMTSGCHVIYIDFEDDQGSVVGRLLTLGVDPQMILDLFHYIRPEHPLKGAHLDALCEELATYRPSPKP